VQALFAATAQNHARVQRVVLDAIHLEAQMMDLTSSQVLP
jgi:hypothetical protein